MDPRPLALRTFALAASGALVLGGCSGSDEPAEPERACAVVSVDEVRDLTGVDVELAEAGDDGETCRYLAPSDEDDEEGAADEVPVVLLRVTSPVEPDSLALGLTSPTELDDLGDEAWATSTGTLLGHRLLVRVGGAMLSIDVADEAIEDGDAADIAVQIARSALDQLPEVEASEPTGPRGEEACEPFAGDEVAELVGGEPELIPTMPLGSCRITVADTGLTVNVSELATNATNEELGAIVASATDPELLDLGERPAYWIANADPTSGGQLDVLDDGTLRQVAVTGTDLEPAQARDLAVAILEAGFGPR